MLAALDAAGLNLPGRTPTQWVVDCKSVGSGTSAIIYLGRYLYRGVIQEKDIVACKDGQVTFRYRDAKTGRIEHRTMPSAQFLWLVLQHVLPKGFRRGRNLGFLHPNCKRLIALLQVLLSFVPVRASDRVRPRPPILCTCCGAVMKIVRTRIAATFVGDPVAPLAVGGACCSCERRFIDGSRDVGVHKLRERLVLSRRGSMRDCRIPAWLAAMASVWCAIARMLTPERHFSGEVSRMYLPVTPRPQCFPQPWPVNFQMGRCRFHRQSIHPGARSPCPAPPHIRFLSIGSRFRSTLPSHTRSPSCSCASLRSSWSTCGGTSTLKIAPMLGAHRFRSWLRTI